MTSKDKYIKTEELSTKSVIPVPSEPGKDLLTINNMINNKELEERNLWIENENTYTYLYPELNDPIFNKKIAQKKRI